MDWRTIFLGAGFEPHREHFVTMPGLLWTLIGANILIAVAYFTIPVALFYFLKQRQDFKHRILVGLFALFIIACGLHHFVHVVTFWYGVYYLQAVTDVITAVVSCIAAIVLWYAIPLLVGLPAPEEHALVKRQVEEQEHEITAQKILDDKRKKFISMVAHELRTPLTSQLLFSEMLLSRIKEGKLKEYAEHVTTVHRQAKKLQKLVEDLLEVSHHDGGSISYHFGRVDINEVVRETVQESRIMAPTHFIKIKGKVKRDVWADRDRIMQVVGNLISNAVKYSPHARRVLVTLKDVGQYAVVSVQDFGMGIDPSHHEKIFEPFYRVQEGSETVSGMGVGLYLSSQIIGRHGGELTVRSQKGEGSVFSFGVPIADHVVASS